MPTPLLQVEALSKRYVMPRHADGGGSWQPGFREWLAGCGRRWLRAPFSWRETAAPDREVLWALRGVSFEVARGEVVGVVGRNGAGKSTLLKILSRITPPTEGEARVWGSMAGLLEVGTGFHPELTGRENILMNGALLGFSRQRMRGLIGQIAEFAGVEDFLDLPVKRYSNGMQVRLGYAVAAHLEPDLLLVDEVLAVGDAAFQKKCLAQLQGLANGERSVLLVSHDLSLVRQFCSRALLLDGGRLRKDGPAQEVLAAYLGAEAQPGTRRWQEADAPGNEHGCLLELGVAGEPVAGGGLRAEAALTLRLVFQLHAAARDLTVGFELHSESGELLLATYSDETGDALPSGRCEAGRHDWRCELPPGLLGSGTFFVSVRLASLGRHWIVKEDALLSFEVRNEGLQRWLAGHPDRRRLRRGLLSPMARWRC